MRFVVDSSVAIKWLVDEGDADLARPFLDFRPDAPDLIIAESTNVLWKKAVKGEIDHGQAVDGVRLLTALRLSLWSGVELSQRAVALSLQLRHAAYDCFYLALSERLSVPFLTADAKLARKVATSELALETVVLAESAALLEKLRA